MRRVFTISGALALTVFSIAGSAATATPTARGWGVDDNNTSTLSPINGNGTAQYITTMPSWFNAALGNVASGNNNGPSGDGYGSATNVFSTNWTFAMAAPAALVPQAVLNSFVYSAWVVTNDGYNLPNGNAAVTYNFGTGGDVGGANYTLNYTPGAAQPGGPGNAIALANVHFFQIVTVLSQFGSDPQNGVINNAFNTTNYFVDNLGSVTTPFYDTAGGTNGTAAAGTQFWMDDSPYRCENQSGVPAGRIAGCQADSASDNTNLLSVSWQADTFIAVDNNPGGPNHNVTLYGGVSWGFQYTNNDVPEPGAFGLAGLGFALLVAGRRRFQRC